MNALASLRRWAWVEGGSLLVLVLIAMPLKHLAGMPMAVRVVGMLHGLAFLIFVSALVRTSSERKWPARVWLTMFGIAFVPGGIFLFRRVIDSAESRPLPKSDASGTP